MDAAAETIASHDAARPVLDLPAPEPSAGSAAYLAERERALAADPRRRANFERYLASGRRSAEVDYLPVKLDIENVSRCNLRCTMCVVSDWPKGRRACDMSLDDFRRLLDEQYGLVEIKLQGIGEPLLAGDVVFAMIAEARSRHIWVRTTTNATLLHLRDNYRRLVDTGINEIQISIDGATKSSYESIRRGAVFERVVDNCTQLNAYCRERGVRITKMWTVVQPGNLDELEALVDLAAGMGFRDQVFSLEMSDWGLDAWRDRNHKGLPATDVAESRLLALVDRGARQGVGVRFWHVVERYSLDRPEKLCPWPFERAYVSSDMRVVSCCYIGNPDVFQIGDAIDRNTSFTDVWTGPAYVEFRRAHLDRSLPQICKNCYADRSRARLRPDIAITAVGD